MSQRYRSRKAWAEALSVVRFVESDRGVDAVIRAAHPLAPILNAAFDHALSYADLAAMLAPRPSVLRREATDDGMWGDLALLYQLGIEQAAAPAAGRKLMFDLAALSLSRLGDRRAAEVHLRRVLATDPGHTAALDAYLQILIDDERYEEATDLLERAVDAAAEEDRPDLLVELASIVYLQLGHPDRALRALLDAHRCDPTRIDVLARARLILIEQQRWADVKRVIDEETAHVLAWGGGEAERAASGPGPADRDEAAIRALAEAYRLLGDQVYASGIRHRLAHECFKRATLLGDEEAREKHDMMVRQAARWSSMAELCRKQGFETRDRRRAALLHLRAAGLQLEYGQDFDGARVALERSWFLDRGNLEALDLLEQAHLERQSADVRPRDLMAALGRMAASAVGPSKVEVLLRVARSAERAEQDPLQWYRRVLELDPDHDEAQRWSERLLALRGRHRERAELLEGRLARQAERAATPKDGSSGYRARRIRLELGRIYAERLGDYARAEAHLEEVLAADPQSFEAASMLRAIYLDTGAVEQLSRVMDVLVEYCPDRASRRDLLQEQGVRGRRLRKWRRRPLARTRSAAAASCTTSGPGDNLASDGREGRAEKKRPLPR